MPVSSPKSKNNLMYQVEFKEAQLLDDRVERQFSEYEIANLAGSLIFRVPQLRAPYLVEITFIEDEVPAQISEFDTRREAIEAVYDDPEAERVVIIAIDKLYALDYEQMVDIREQNG